MRHEVLIDVDLLLLVLLLALPVGWGSSTLGTDDAGRMKSWSTRGTVPWPPWAPTTLGG